MSKSSNTPGGLIGPFVDLITFKAFAPDKQDSRISVSKRLLGQKFIGVNLGLNHIVCSTIRVDKQGDIHPTNIESIVLREPSACAHHLREYANKNECRYALALCSHAFDTIKVIPSPSIDEGILNKTLRTEPERVFGSVEDDKRYGLILNKEYPVALKFTFSKERLYGLERYVKDAGLELLMLQNGTYSIISKLAVNAGENFIGDRPVLIVDTNAIALLKVEAGEWVEVFYRQNETTGDPGRVITAMMGRLSDDVNELGYVCANDFDINSFFELTYPTVKLVNLMDMDTPQIVCAAGESLPVDLREVYLETRPYLPRKGALAMIAYYAAIGGIALVLAWQYWQQYTIQAERDTINAALDDNASQITRLQSQVATIEQDVADAMRLGDWVRINYHAQGLLDILFDERPHAIRIAKAEIIPSEGINQIRMNLDFVGDTQAISELLAKYNDRLERSGYQLLDTQQPTTNKGMRFEATYSMPIPESNQQESQ